MIAPGAPAKLSVIGQNRGIKQHNVIISCPADGHHRFPRDRHGAEGAPNEHTRSQVSVIEPSANGIEEVHDVER